MFQEAMRSMPNVPLSFGARVLDVGCGNRPFTWATHLVDVTLDDHSQRFGEPVRTDGRPLVVASVEALPFPDKYFDFVHCAHVLEHVAAPAVACEELSRVGRRGYVECPRSWVEFVFSAVGHRWLVDGEGGELIFREKLPEEYGDPLGIRDSLLPRLARDRAFARHWNAPALRAIRNVEYFWAERVRYRILRAGERRSDGVVTVLGRETNDGSSPAAAA